MLDEFATIKSQGMENKAEFRPSKSAAEQPQTVGELTMW